MLQEQRVEYERIQRELVRLGPQLTEALEARETEARNCRVAQDRAASKDQENELLRRQLSDLAMQVKHLLREIAIRDDPSLENEDVDMHDNVPAMADTDDTNKIITSQLVLFKNLSELQQQNQRLVHVTRKMSQEMEQKEKELRETAEANETNAVRRAKTAIEGLHAKIQSQEASERALKKEIDMLSGMLLKLKQQGGSVANGIVAAPAGNMVLEGDRLGEMSMVLKEMGANTARVQEELTASQKQVGQLNVALAKANAQVDFLSGMTLLLFLLIMCLTLDALQNDTVSPNSRTTCRSENFLTYKLGITKLKARLPASKSLVTNPKIKCGSSTA